MNKRHLNQAINSLGRASAQINRANIHKERCYDAGGVRLEPGYLIHQLIDVLCTIRDRGEESHYDSE